jgi:Fur family ferric uptake transcriptional regulator
MVFDERRVARIMRRRGFKLTPQRRAILHVIKSSPDHLTPAAIHEAVNREAPGIGLVTIYRTLNILAELGLICEIHTAGQGRSYLLRRPKEHHHHLVCSGCGKVVDFTGCDLGRMEARLARDTGFTIEAHLLEFLGLCPRCQRQAQG